MDDQRMGNWIPLFSFGNALTKSMHYNANAVRAVFFN